MWKRFEVVLQIDGELAASLPYTREEIKAMLENRMPGKEPANAVPIADLVEQVTAEVGGDEGESLPGWATFPRDDKGLYYEGRCIRGHLKDCALQVSGLVKPEVKNFRSKFVNKVYVETKKIYLGKDKPDGMQQRFIQVMTRKGWRSSYKYIDFIKDASLEFVLKVLDDGIITEDHLKAVFEYGGTHGLGGERSQGWGRYELKALTEKAG